MRSRSERLGASLAALVAAAVFMPCAASAAAPPNSPLNGFWNVDDAVRAAAQRGAKAELTPAGQAIAKANQAANAARLARGQVVGLGSYTCGALGMPFTINTSEPWLLVVTDEAVTQVTERRQIPPRVIYTDGRSLPDVSKLPPANQGYSVGHWEGGDLLVETVGLPPGGIAGGGLKGPKTILRERFKLSPDNKQLFWTLTWEDPELLVQPYSYTVKYDRAPAHTYALTHDCDPNEGAAATVEEPPQQ